MATLDDQILSLRPGAKVDLYEIDLTRMNGPRLRLTPNRESIIPQEVLRMQDARTNVNESTRYAQVLDIPVGSRVFFEGYVRRLNGDGFPAIKAEDPDSNTTWWGVAVNPNTGLAAVRTGPTNPASAGNVSAAVAGEYIYFYGRFTWGRGGMILRIHPALGNNFPNTAAAAVATMDLAGLRVARLHGGTMIPVPVSLDADLWLNDTIPMPATLNPSAPGAQLVKPPVWGGNAYTPIPIEATGFERTGTGAFPRPRLRMSNLFSEGSALTQEFGDMRGATVTRRRVHVDNLDNGRNPDPMAAYHPEIYRVTRKAMQNSIMTEWELASVMDQEGVKLPGRQILRDVCQWTYRVWNGSAWEYAGANGCPYTGSAMFDMNGEPVSNPQEDRCSHTLQTGCRARYGTTAPLPFGGFPMVDRF